MLCSGTNTQKTNCITFLKFVSLCKVIFIKKQLNSSYYNFEIIFLSLLQFEKNSFNIMIGLVSEIFLVKHT